MINRAGLDSIKACESAYKYGCDLSGSTVTSQSAYCTEPARHFCPPSAERWAPAWNQRTWLYGQELLQTSLETTVGIVETELQSQKAVIAHFSSRQLLLFGFALQYCRRAVLSSDSRKTNMIVGLKKNAANTACDYRAVSWRKCALKNHMGL